MRRNAHRRLTAFFLALLAMSLPHARAQLFDGRMSILVHGALTTASSVFLRPDAETPEQRLQSDSYNALLGGGVEVRVPVFGGDFYLSASAGYSQRIDARRRAFAFPDTLLLVPVEEGVRFIPVELGLNAIIPLGSESFRLSMGAGAGVYYLARVLRVAGRSASVDNFPIDVNMFIDIAFEYRLTSDLALHAAFKFLDPEVRCENRFSDPSITYNGRTGLLPTVALPSKVAIDGMHVSLGLIVEVW